MDKLIKCKMITTFIENSRRIFEVGEIVEFEPKLAVALQELGRLVMLPNDVEIVKQPEPEPLPEIKVEPKHERSFDEDGIEHDESINDVVVPKPKKEIEATVIAKMNKEGEVIASQAVRHPKGRPPKVK